MSYAHSIVKGMGTIYVQEDIVRPKWCRMVSINFQIPFLFFIRGTICPAISMAVGMWLMELYSSTQVWWKLGNGLYWAWLLWHLRNMQLIALTPNPHQSDNSPFLREILVKCDKDLEELRRTHFKFILIF